MKITQKNLIKSAKFLLSDSLFIKIKYYLSFNQLPKLSEPKLFTEKLQWLKLNDRNMLYTICADKIEAKKYVKSIIGDKYLIPTEKVLNALEELTLTSIPLHPSILKTSHDSGGAIILTDPAKIDLDNIKKRLNQKLSRNFYYEHREWEYKNIVPRIIIEPLLKDNSGNQLLNDYKIHCFHGKPHFIQTIFDRQEGVKEDWFDVEWNPLDMWYFSSMKRKPVKPSNLKEMLHVAEKLSKEFPYVRIDLYEIDGKTLFGEFTFRPYGGFMKWNDPKWDKCLGELIELPNNG